MMERATAVEDLIATYPRCRPPLPAAQSESYVEHYRANRSGERGLSRIVVKLESWMHRRVAEGADEGRILEIGAGTLNHVPYHPHARVYDAVEPFRQLWEESPHRPRVRHICASLSELAETQRYDGIISIAVLEHLTELPSVLARAGLLLEEGGTFRAGFPSEGGMLWGLAWRWTTGIEYFLKRGLAYSAIMRHEHVNSAKEIIALLGYFYERLEVSRFPLPFAHLSFYTAVIARHPRLDRCRAFRTHAERLGTCAYE
jgi:hypothetical protein